MKLIITIFFFSFFNISIGQVTLIPDILFEMYLVDQGWDSVLDGSVPTSNISSVTDVDVSGYSIGDLTGIEDFSALTHFLMIGVSTLTEDIDLSQNTNLSSVEIHDLYAYFDTINVSGLSLDTMTISWAHFVSGQGYIDASNSSILGININYTSGLETIDLGMSPDLENLSVIHTSLSSLDLSDNISLDYVDVYGDNLSCLNLNNGAVISSVDLTGNNLNCVSVFDPVYAYNNYSYDVVTFSSTNCQDPGLISVGNQLESLDTNNSYQWLDCDDNYAILPGDTNQTFTPLSSGYYSVEVNAYTCNYGADTSDCVYVNCGLIDNDVIPNGSILSAEQFGATYQWLDCSNNHSIISGETNQTYTPISTGYYAVEITWTNDCSGIDVDTSSCHFVEFSSFDDYNFSDKKVIKIMDVTGREVPYQPNTVLIYLYSDGTTQRVYDMR